MNYFMWNRKYTGGICKGKHHPQPWCRRGEAEKLREATQSASKEANPNDRCVGAAVLQVMEWPALLSKMSPTACGTVLLGSSACCLFSSFFWEKWWTNRPPATAIHHRKKVLFITCTWQKSVSFSCLCPGSICVSAQRNPFLLGIDCTDPSQLCPLPSGTTAWPRTLTFGFKDGQAICLHCLPTYSANTPICIM